MSLFSRYAEGTKKAIELAQKEAVNLGHPFIGTEHLLLGLIAQGGEAKQVLGEFGVTLDEARKAVSAKVGDVSAGAEAMDARALEPVGIDLKAVKGKVEEAFGEGALKIPPGRPRFTPRSARVLEMAVGKAAGAGSDRVEPEHLLRALISDPDGFASQVLEQLAEDPAALRTRLGSSFV